MEVTPSQYDTRWQGTPDTINGDTPKKYMFSPDIVNPVMKHIYQHICSYNDAKYFDSVKFDFTDIANKCPFFYYKLTTYYSKDPTVEFIQNQGYYSFKNIHDDNKFYSTSKMYIAYTLSMVIFYIEEKFGLNCIMPKSPMNHNKWLMWVQNNKGETVKFLRNSEGSNEWDNVDEAANAIYDYYLDYYKSHIN